MEGLNTAVRTVLLALAALVAGCAGWSSWEDGREQPAIPQRAPGPDEYRVVRGDTVYSIAFRNSLDFRQLARWNGIGNDYLIHPGQILRLKPPPGWSAESQQPVAGGSGVSRPSSPATVPSAAPSALTGAVPRPPPVSVDPEVGRYDWNWPTAGTIVRAFGQDGNRGLDFGGREGQPVLAAAPGRVVYSGNALKGYGELIIIKHDETYLSAYGYNRSRHVREGDLVTAGQPIGEMGRGPENRPLLHFEIRRQGKPINPAEKLPQRDS